jgi:hypothetical protein
VISGGVYLQEIVPAPGAGKQVCITSVNAVGLNGVAATGNTSLTLRYDSSTINISNLSVIMAAAGNTYTYTGLGNTSASGDKSNTAVNVALINSTDQSLACTIFVRVTYIIMDTTTGF